MRWSVAHVWTSGRSLLAQDVDLITKENGRRPLKTWLAHLYVFCKGGDSCHRLRGPFFRGIGFGNLPPRGAWVGVKAKGGGQSLPCFAAAQVCRSPERSRRGSRKVVEGSVRPTSEQGQNSWDALPSLTSFFISAITVVSYFDGIRKEAL